MSACLLSLSVISLLLPTAFHASFNDQHLREANSNVVKVSRGVSVILLLVYVLYLVFQLKSHAYMYESTPQHIVDEESHPGVLHDLMNSSSSSSDSSSSSSSSDTDSDASGSVATTSKRVKRMFKHRKRRKSSASTSTTATTSNLPSVISTPSTEKPSADYCKDPSRPASRRESTLAAIASGDEGDNEDGRTRTFDWAERHNSNDTTKSPDPPKRHRTRRAKKREKERKRRQKQEDAADTAAAEASGAPFATRSSGPLEVARAEDLQTSENPAQNASPNKRPFNIRAPVFRPALSSYLSNTVFSSQQPVPINGVTPRAGPVQPVSAGQGGLRRTSSLPDRLNHSVAPAQASSSSGPLGTIQHQVDKTPNGLSNDTSAADVDEKEGEAVMSRTAAVVLLLASTALVAICAEFMVDAIPGMIKDSSVSEAFIGLIILPIVGNAAEHVTAVTVAAKNKMDLAIGIAVGSSIQIALFVTPIVVLLGWALSTDMSLYFNIFETVSLFVTVFVVNFLVLDGRSNYLEGSLLIAAYVIIAVAAFFYPASASQSNIGGGGVAGAGSS